MANNKSEKSTIDIEVCDITKVKCDAIVNAANKSLLGGGGVDGAIHRVAGPELLEECRTLNGCETGQAKITKGYNLPAKYVIHTVGPIYSGNSEDEVMLTKCYQNSLTVARKNNLHTIAFSAISTGVYGYPLEDACEVALVAVGDWLVNNEDYHMEVLMTCFDDEVYDEYEDFIDVYDDGNDYIYDAGY
ncbi:O-acetyl-ADP-ribose deacetylase [Companilactobacillus jidongensis]|uniref:O-acetyl-ADP-ribose deacetylase n=1 Tax=Companilactobacillus jidongensis TaxID=2486006 RepID=UPI000F774E70|nr:O-acetyl-ADP-ribose deacetylase [Companilactobacillus jidongensis]